MHFYKLKFFGSRSHAELCSTENAVQRPCHRPTCTRMIGESWHGNIAFWEIANEVIAGPFLSVSPTFFTSWCFLPILIFVALRAKLKLNYEGSIWLKHITAILVPLPRASHTLSWQSGPAPISVTHSFVHMTSFRSFQFWRYKFQKAYPNSRI